MMPTLVGCLDMAALLARKARHPGLLSVGVRRLPARFGLLLTLIRCRLFMMTRPLQEHIWNHWKAECLNRACANTTSWAVSEQQEPLDGLNRETRQVLL